MKKIILVFALVFTLLCSCRSYASMYKADIKDGYSSGSAFHHGITVVVKNHEYGVIDIYGNTVIPFDEKEKFICSNGLVKVIGENKKFAYFDKYGNRLTEYIYDAFYLEPIKQNPGGLYHAEPGGDGKSDLIPVSRDHKYGFMNSKGEEQIPLQFEYAYGFFDGVARICSEGVLSQWGTYTSGKYGYILENGDILKAPDTYWTADNFKYGYAYADGNVIDKSGNNIYQYNANYTCGAVFEGYSIATDYSGRIGIVDINGNVIIPFDYSFKEHGGGGNFIIDQKILKNAQNEIIYVAPEGQTLRGAGGGYNVYPFIQTSIVVGPYHIQYGLIDSTGRTILNTKFESIYVYPDGLIYARTSSGNYFYDYEGKRICTAHGNDMYYYGDGFLGVREFDTKSWGYIANPIIYPKVFVNGSKLESDVYAKIENGRTFLPMRAIFESLGAEVSWNDETRTVTAKKNETVITLTIGEKVLHKNNEAVEIDVAPKLENSRTLVPVRAVAEALGCNVFWNEMSRQVIINMFDSQSMHDTKLEELMNEEHRKCIEMIRSEAGTVLLSSIATPHGASSELLFIDNSGKVDSLYENVPRNTLFTVSLPEALYLSDNEETLFYEFSFPTCEIVDFSDDAEALLHEAGTYIFEVKLDSREFKKVKYEPFPELYTGA